MATPTDSILVLGSGASAYVSAGLLMQRGLSVHLCAKNKSWPESAVVSLSHASQRIWQDAGLNLPQSQKVAALQVHFDQHTLDIEDPKAAVFCLNDLMAEAAKLPVQRIDEANNTATRWRLLTQPVHEWPLYAQHAYSAWVELPDHQNIARQWFHQQEVIALLPTKNRQRAALILSTQQHYQTDNLLSHLKTFDHSITGLCHLSPAMPLYHGHRSHYLDNQLIYLGQAAHATHPMAGLGLNMALADAYELSQTQLDPLALSRYATKRYRKNADTMMVINGLYQLFCDNNWLRPWASFTAAQLQPFTNLKTRLVSCVQDL